MARAEPSGTASTPQPFERRIVAILNAGGTADTVQSRLDRVAGEGPLTADQRVAVDAVRTLVRSKARAKGLSLAEAESFAARNPGSPASSILLAEAALANDQPQRSADLIIAAARSGPLVELVSPATLSKLTTALDKQADKRRAADLAKAVLNAGWGRGSASLRSYLAITAIRDELASGRRDEARRYLPAIASPASLHLVLIDNRLASLRAEVIAATGPRLERAWDAYLTKTRDDWLERGDVLSASAYAEALKQANQYAGLVGAFLPRFVRGYNCPSDLVARTVGPDLADSLARIGRWTKAEDVMRRSGGVAAPVYAAMLLERGEFGRAVPLFDRSLSAASAPENEDEKKALAWLQAARDCAAFRNGGRDNAPRYDPSLLDVTARLLVHLCMDRTAEARAALIAALDDEDERADALRWVQPFADPPVQSAFRKDMSARMRALQRDPAVLEAVSRYGVILDWPLTASAPKPDAGTKSSPAWQCGDEASWKVNSAPDSVHLPDSQP